MVIPFGYYRACDFILLLVLTWRLLAAAAVVLQDEAHIVNIMLVVLLFGTLLAAVALIPVFCRYGRKNAEPDAPLDRTKPVMGHSTVLYVYAVLLAAMAVLETPWLHALIGQNPFAWCVCMPQCCY